MIVAGPLLKSLGPTTHTSRSTVEVNRCQYDFLHEISGEIDSVLFGVLEVKAGRRIMRKEFPQHAASTDVFIDLSKAI